MKIFDLFAPRLYTFVKKHPRLRRLILPLWQVASGVRQKLRAAVDSPLPPPTTLFESANPATQSDGPKADDLTVREIFSTQRVVRATSRSLDKTVHERFVSEHNMEFPAANLAIVPKGRVWFGSYCVAAITSSNELLTPFSYAIEHGVERYQENANEHPVFRERRLLPPERLKGSAAVLAAPGGGGYYHWMVDLLPRLHLLEQANIPVESIDHFVVNNYVAKFQQ